MRKDSLKKRRCVGGKTRRAPLIIGLTGSIGMGKSTAAKILRGFGIPVYDADRVVHGLLKRNGKAVKPVARLFPETLKGGGIDRDALGLAVFGNATHLKQLEKILHPLVLRAERAFVAEAARKNAKAVVLEIPLLFETNSDKRCDVTLCMMAPRAIQQARLLERPGMTLAKMRAIVKHQMPDREKRRRAAFVITSGKGYADTKRQLAQLWASWQEQEKGR